MTDAQPPARACGRAWVAIRDSEIAAQSMGVNVAVYKSVAFAYSAGVMAPSGAAVCAQDHPISRPTSSPSCCRSGCCWRSSWRAWLAARRGVRLLPRPQGTRRAARRLAVGRRAADASDQPRADGAPQGHATRRALARPKLVKDIFDLINLAQENGAPCSTTSPQDNNKQSDKTIMRV
jgi:hypothetical protein